MQKTAWSRRKHELTARRRLVEQAVVVLLLHDIDRCWLPAFMRKHGMRDVDEELSAFDEVVVNHFLALSLEDMNAMRAPTDQRGKTRFRDAQAFIMEHRLQAWVATHNERHGLAPTVGDAPKHRDELAAAVQVEEMQPSPLWSAASSARYKWSARFRKRWRVGLKKPHAREAVPLEVARQMAIPLNRKGQAPSQFGVTSASQLGCLPVICASPLCRQTRPFSAKKWFPKHAFPIFIINSSKDAIGVGSGVVVWRKLLHTK